MIVDPLSIMEAFGVVLGILPLIISAIEHYDFFAPFVCHCEFTRELQCFRRKLDARKLLFRNECRLLLEEFIQEHVVEEMFKDGSRHPSWEDEDMNERIRRHLGESYEAYIDMVKAIDGHVDKLKEKTKGFGIVLAPKPEVRAIHLNTQSAYLGSPGRSVTGSGGNVLATL